MNTSRSTYKNLKQPHFFRLFVFFFFFALMFFFLFFCQNLQHHILELNSRIIKKVSLHLHMMDHKWPGLGPLVCPHHYVPTRDIVFRYDVACIKINFCDTIKYLWLGCWKKLPQINPRPCHHDGPGSEAGLVVVVPPGLFVHGAAIHLWPCCFALEDFGHRHLLDFLTQGGFFLSPFWVSYAIYIKSGREYIL